MLDKVLSKQKQGSDTKDLLEIAQLTANPMERNVIMNAVWDSMNHAGKNWLQIYKSLTLLEFLVKNGAERVID